MGRLYKVPRFAALLIALLPLSCASAVDYQARFEGFESSRSLMDDWYGVYFADRKVGWEHIEITGGSIDGTDVIRIRDVGNVVFIIEDENNPETYISSGEVFLTDDGRLLGFKYDQSQKTHKLSIVGEAKEGVVYIDITSGGTTQRVKFDESARIYPATALSYFSLIEDISTGKTYTYRVFLEGLRLTEDITIRILDQEEVTVNGQTETAYRVEGTIRGYTFTSFMRADGTVIKQVTMDNFVMLRETKEQAMRMDPGPACRCMLSSTTRRLPPTGRLPIRRAYRP